MNYNFLMNQDKKNKEMMGRFHLIMRLRNQC